MILTLVNQYVEFQVIKSKNSKQNHIKIMASTFIVIYKNGKMKDLEAQNRTDLIITHFEGNEQKFKDEVKLLRWQQGTVSYTENIENGKTDENVATADTNPYGWRNEVKEAGKPIKSEEFINNMPKSTDRL
ncbi:MAG: hypothetical protein COZ18_10775 [Flexibacter sp. CG_4_10_14_3_um_filter_32_15]|nr:MAG: hypothetical protein COZ18_10775 [Flexibacter sp. CG_4_10_14_3_um_filter_32_15]